MASFTPPARYDFEPELHGPAPRPLPDALSRGPHPAQRRRGAIGLAMFGGFCLLVSGIPLVRTAGLYFLPLAWASWIGIGSLALAAVSWADLSLRAGRARWVRDGSPLVAQVLELVKAPSAIVNGNPAQGRFTATVAFEHPETAAAAVAHLQSDDFSWDAREQYDTPFRVGDYVTALFFPGQFDKSLRLYAFLGLRAEHELRRDRAKPSSPWVVVALLFGLATLFTGLVGGCIAYGLYEPIDFDYGRAAVPIAVGAIGLGGALLAALWLMHRAQVRKSAEYNRRAIESGAAIELTTPFLGSGAHGWIVGTAVVLGAPLVGGVLTLCWLFFANAWLDESEPSSEPARIENLVMTTHGLVFREYQIEYELSASGARGKLLSTPEHMATLASPDAVALVRAGALGWPWVESIEARPE
jgi:hypothetical protein